MVADGMAQSRDPLYDGWVFLGSFAKLGNTIRISIKVQEAATGEILNAGSVDAVSREGRLLALEVMGQLVEYYRVGMRRSNNPEEAR